MPQPRVVLIWGGFVLALVVPVAAALASPLLAWRDAVYTAAGIAGVFGLALLLAQPLLAVGYLPGIPARWGRWLHRVVGGLLLLAVAVHVGGLWITSPPDVIDAFLFASPTPFSAWGVVAMWAILATATLAALRRRWTFGLRRWRMAHGTLALVIVVSTAVHALLIEGTMEPVSKAILCALVIAATLKALLDLRTFLRRRTVR